MQKKKKKKKQERKKKKREIFLTENGWRTLISGKLYHKNNIGILLSVYLLSIC